MADNTTTEDGRGKIVSFRPRSEGPVAPPPLPPLPPLPAAPPAPSRTAPADNDVPAAFHSGGLPSASAMAPPAALLMPPPPPLPSLPESEAGEDELVLPGAEDPDNPTGRETVQVCMALMAALGVAAAKGMWHRARHRQALADEARAVADRAKAKAAANGHHGGTGAGGGTGGGRGGSKGGGGVLSGLRQEGGSRRRSGGSQTGGHDGPGRKRKGPKTPKPPKAPKAAPDAGPGAKPRKRSKARSKAKGGLGDQRCLKNRDPDAKGKTPKGPKAPRATPGGKTRPGDPAAKRPAPLKWKAAKRTPGPGGDKALPPGRKRWQRPAAPGKDKPGGKGSKGSKNRKGGGKGGKGSRRRTWRTWAGTRRTWWTRASKRRAAWWATWTSTPEWTIPWTWWSTPEWLKRWRTRRAAASSTSSAAGAGSRRTATGSTGWHRDGRESWARTPPPPPPGGEWMRPPPGADRSTRITVERVDVRPRQQHQRRQSAPAAAVAGAPAARRPALAPAAASSTTTTATATAFRRAAPSPATDDRPTVRPTVQAAAGQATATAGGQMNRFSIPAGAVPGPRPSHLMTGGPGMPAHGTQYDDDAELTIRDVIEAAEDAAEEITEGVEAARATAVGAERMAGRLEALHAEIRELKVPGWLEAIWGRLVDKALHVKASAEGLAEALPAASEAISVAAANAAARDLGVADTTRDYGHIRPAEREYHDE